MNVKGVLEKLVLLGVDSVNVNRDSKASRTSKKRVQVSSVELQCLSHGSELSVILKLVRIRVPSPAHVYIHWHGGICNRHCHISSIVCGVPVHTEPLWSDRGQFKGIVLDESLSLESTVTTLPHGWVAVTLTRSHIAGALGRVAVVHCLDLVGGHGAISSIGGAAEHSIVEHHVGEELKSRWVIVDPVGDEVARLRHSQVGEGLVLSEVAPGCRPIMGCIIPMVYLSCLAPEGFLVGDFEATEPWLLGTGTILRIELTGVDKDLGVLGEERGYVRAVVDHVVGLESVSHSR